MDRLRTDLRHALRQSAAHPGVTVLAALTLALGIGASTAVFSVVDAVLLRPFPFPRQERLVLMWERDDVRGQPFVEVSFPAFLDWRAASHGFESMAAMPATNSAFTWTGDHEPQQIQTRLVSGDFFRVLAVKPALGRALGAEDDRVGAPRVVVVSHRFWSATLGADPAAVGRTMILEGTPFTVVGVMPAAFAYPAGVDLWTPVVPVIPEYAAQREICWAIVLGRLRDGVSLEAARTEMEAVARRVDAQDPDPAGRRAVVRPLVGELVGEAGPRLWLLMGGVGVFLLLACSNVAGLLLVRGTARRREIAIRLAVGASRRNLLRQLLTESAVLALAGGAAGVLAAAWVIRALVAIGPRDVPRLAEAGLDARALAFALAASTLAVLAAGLAPALQAIWLGTVTGLRDSAPAAVGGGRRTRSLLVAAQVTLAALLLTGGALLARSFLRLRSVDLGFQAERLLSLEVTVPTRKYPRAAERRAFAARLLERVRVLPGVESAAMILLRPLWGTVGMDWYFTAEGQSEADATHNPLLNLEAITPGYFRTMGIPIVAGRDFDDRDDEGRPGVLLVSRGLAERYWPGQDPLGKRVKLRVPDTAYDRTWLQVVGVAGDARYRELQATRLDAYLTYRQWPDPLRHLVVRTSGEPTAPAAAIRGIVKELDPDQPVDDVVAMADVVADARHGARFGAEMLGGLALLGLVLAAVGLYGVMAQSAVQRTREIGVRMALGAEPRHVIGLVARQGLAPAAAGLLMGLALGLALSRLLRGALFEIGPADPLSFAGVALLVLATAALAGAVPARRATRVDPTTALRDE